jgi:uncharacterized protein YbjT (DUF2867 family)
MRVMVLGGTGTVGSNVTRELLARGVEVHVLTRGTSGKHVPEGAFGVQGDLLDPRTVRTAFAGMDGLFLVNGWSMSECHEGLMAVCGARGSEVGRIVYLSVHRVDEAAYLPHFGAKLGIEAAVAGSGIPYTILRPSNFHQNDHWFKDAILQYGVYPQPLGDVGVSRVDVRDIAEAAALAFTEDGHDGETYNLVGPEPMTGESTARVWSETLGREIRYGGNEMDPWEEMNLRYMPAPQVYDFRLMYEFFQREGLLATGDDVDRQTELLGHAPRSFVDFARETAVAWGHGS